MTEFLLLAEADWLKSLASHHLHCMRMPPDGGQMAAWRDCFRLLHTRLPKLLKVQPSAAAWTVIFEYELPRERGRRPDLVVLAGSQVLVLEFKETALLQQAHVDQVAAYARDLANYHAVSHGHSVRPVLVLTRSKIATETRHGVSIASPGELSELLGSFGQQTDGQPLDPAEWLTADYSPLPSLVSAARSLFKREPLPHIRRAHSAGVPITIEELVRIARHAASNHERHLALVTGVPGAGKTLVGLQLVYTKILNLGDEEKSALFLSGNGPLVKVLQHALKSSVFVQDVHGFLKQYGGDQERRPKEHVWVYDEAQRAWDASRVEQKRGHGVSEPADFLRLGARMESWALVVGLIGEGQEIHLGEEAGLGQWNDAIRESAAPWVVHCPDKIAYLFTHAATTHTSEQLDLTVSLRSHIAEDVQRWVTQLLGGQLDVAPATASQVARQGFDMYVTRNLEVAKAYVRERYTGQEDKRFGLLASSKASNLPKWGIHTEFQYTKRLREGPWYNDEPSSKFSCCQLHDVATEFACQGLELDFPIIGWGDDLLWNGRAWVSKPQLRSKALNPHQLRLNSYRVLLSRGRDGFVVFVPPESTLDDTYAALQDAGLLSLG